MTEKNEKASHIVIDGEAYEMINVLAPSGELIASITSSNIITKSNCEVELVKDASKVRFQEMG